MKSSATRDITVGGPNLASHSIRAGLVDEHHHFITPIVMGSGIHWLPDDVRFELELLDERRFDRGVTHLRYRATT